MLPGRPETFMRSCGRLCVEGDLLYVLAKTAPRNFDVMVKQLAEPSH